MAIDLSTLVNPSVTGTMTVDTITEKTLNNGVTIDSVKLKDGEAYNSANQQLANVQNVQDSSAKNHYYMNNNSIANGYTPLGSGYTGSFTILIQFMQKLWVSNSVVFNMGNDAPQNPYFNFNSAGNLFFTNGANGGVNAAISNGVVYNAVGVYDQSQSNKMSLYMNGALAGSYNYVAGMNLGSLGYKFGSGLVASYPYYGSVYKTIVFNYAITDQNKIARYSAGAKLDYEDIGGSNSSLVPNGSFTSDTTGWTPTLLTLASVAGGQSGNCLQATWSSGVSQAVTGSSFPLIVGKKYKLTGYYKQGTGNGNIQIRVKAGSSNYYGAVNYTPSGSWQAITPVEFTAVDTSAVIEIIVGTTSGTQLFDEISLIQLGAVLDLEPENITDTTWFDSSSNSLHGYVTGALAQRYTPAYDSKNYIINGAMEFNQRGQDLTNGQYAANGTFILDRWKKYTTMSVLPYNGGVLGSYISLATGAGGGTGMFGYRQIIENPISLKNKYVTLTAAVSGNLTNFTSSAGSPGLYFVIYDGITTQYVKVLDAGANYPSPLLKSATFKLGAFTGDLTVTILVCGAGGANVTLSQSDQGLNLFAGVMLNEGPVVAPFQRAGGTIAGELALCQRYYEKSYNVTVAPGAASTSGALSSALEATTNYAPLYWNFKTRKRTVPLVKFYNPVTGTENSMRGDSSNYSAVIEAAYTGENSCLIHANNVSIGAWTFISVQATADAEI